MSKIKIYHFTCPEGHHIEKQYKFETGKANSSTQVRIYCADCDKFYPKTLPGNIAPNKVVTRD